MTENLESTPARQLRLLAGVAALAPFAVIGLMTGSPVGSLVVVACMAASAGLGVLVARSGLGAGHAQVSLCESCRVSPPEFRVEFADGARFDVCADCCAAATSAQPAARSLAGAARMSLVTEARHTTSLDSGREHSKDF